MSFLVKPLLSLGDMGFVAPLKGGRTAERVLATAPFGGSRSLCHEKP